MTAEMKACADCDSSGFSDKCHRGAWAMEPRDKLCRTCGGRGWVRDDARTQKAQEWDRQAAFGPMTFRPNPYTTEPAKGRPFTYNEAVRLHPDMKEFVEKCWRIQSWKTDRIFQLEASGEAVASASRKLLDTLERDPENLDEIGDAWLSLNEAVDDWNSRGPGERQQAGAPCASAVTSKNPAARYPNETMEGRMEIGRIEELKNPVVELLPDGSIRFQFWRVDNFHGTQTDLALAILDWLKEQVVLPKDAPDFSLNPTFVPTPKF